MRCLRILLRPTHRNFYFPVIEFAKIGGANFRRGRSDVAPFLFSIPHLFLSFSLAIGDCHVARCRTRLNPTYRAFACQINKPKNNFRFDDEECQRSRSRSKNQGVRLGKIKAQQRLEMRTAGSSRQTSACSWTLHTSVHRLTKS